MQSGSKITAHAIRLKYHSHNASLHLRHPNYCSDAGPTSTQFNVKTGSQKINLDSLQQKNFQTQNQPFLNLQTREVFCINSNV